MRIKTETIKSLLEGLETIGMKAFPQKVVMGANPEIKIDRENLNEVVEASIIIQSKVQSA